MHAIILLTRNLVHIHWTVWAFILISGWLCNFTECLLLRSSLCHCSQMSCGCPIRREFRLMLVLEIDHEFLGLSCLLFWWDHIELAFHIASDGPSWLLEMFFRLLDVIWCYNCLVLAQNLLPFLHSSDSVTRLLNINFDGWRLLKLSKSIVVYIVNAWLLAISRSCHGSVSGLATFDYVFTWGLDWALSSQTFTRHEVLTVVNDRCGNLLNVLAAL